MASPPEEVGLRETRDKENNIIIINYAPQNILSYQLKKCMLVTRLCVGVSGVYLPRVLIITCYHGDIFIPKNEISKLKYAQQNIR